MAFTPKTAPYSGKINAVTLGTGDKAVVIGGQNVMPFCEPGAEKYISNARYVNISHPC